MESSRFSPWWGAGAPKSPSGAREPRASAPTSPLISPASARCGKGEAGPWVPSRHHHVPQRGGTWTRGRRYGPGCGAPSVGGPLPSTRSLPHRRLWVCAAPMFVGGTGLCLHPTSHQLFAERPDLDPHGLVQSPDLSLFVLGFSFCCHMAAKTVSQMTPGLPPALTDCFIACSVRSSWNLDRAGRWRPRCPRSSPAGAAAPSPPGRGAEGVRAAGGNGHLQQLLPAPQSLFLPHHLPDNEGLLAPCCPGCGRLALVAQC